jgi:hypothetical protein
VFIARKQTLTGVPDRSNCLVADGHHVVDGVRAMVRASGTVDSGPAVTTNAAIRASTTARGSRRCAGVGGRLEMVKACSSRTVERVFTVVSTKRARRNARSEHTSCGRRHEVVRLSRSAQFRPAESLAARGQLARTCWAIPCRGQVERKAPRDWEAV